MTSLTSYKAFAQTALPLPINNHEIGSECELYILPADKVSAASQGSDLPGLIPALMAGETAKHGDFASKVFSHQGQIEIISAAHPVDIMGLPSNTTIATDDTGQGSGDEGNMTNKLCYFELKVDYLVYARHPIYGRQIVSKFSFRSFKSSKLMYSYSQRFRTTMQDFGKATLPKSPEEEKRMSDMMDQAFSSAFKTFADRINGKLKAS